MGRDIEIRIAFKGQAKALKQFRNMLVPAGNGGTVNTTAEGDDGSVATTVTTIKAAGPAPFSDAQGSLCVWFCLKIHHRRDEDGTSPRRRDGRDPVGS